MSDFYRKFEDKHRGSREAIKLRLAAYSDFIEAAKGKQKAPIALDLGCGRGEWLELLGENGFDASGIDLDAGMLQACQERGLKVQQADLFEHLKGIEDHSIHLLSAFHVIEHIPFEQLQILMNESLRVLAPGGILIFETPNPENLTVASTSFHMDPTHNKPLPPKLMDFLAEYHGFGRSTIYRLDNFRAIREDESIYLTDVLFFVSPDYALIAQAPALEEKSEDAALWGGLFAKERGHSLENMSQRFEQRIANQFAEQYDGFQQAAQELQGQIDELHQAYVAIMESHSWKVTRPLRGAAALYRQIRDSLKSYTKSPKKSASKTKPDLAAAKWWVKRRVGFVLHKLQNVVSQNPRLKKTILTVLERVPWLSKKMHRMMNPSFYRVEEDVPNPHSLTPEAMQLHAQIKRFQNQAESKD